MVPSFLLAQLKHDFPLTSRSAGNTDSLPHRHLHKKSRCPWRLLPAALTTVHDPNTIPGAILCFILAHPQLVVFPLLRKSSLISFSLPHSHRHSMYLLSCPPGSRLPSTSRITASRPNSSPILICIQPLPRLTCPLRNAGLASGDNLLKVPPDKSRLVSHLGGELLELSHVSVLG